MLDMILVLLYQVGIFPNTSRRWKRSPKKVSVWDTLNSDSDYTASGEEEEGGEDEEEEEGKSSASIFGLICSMFYLVHAIDIGKSLNPISTVTVSAL